MLFLILNTSETLRKNSCVHSMEEKIFFDLNLINNALHIRVNFKKTLEQLIIFCFLQILIVTGKSRGEGQGRAIASPMNLKINYIFYSDDFEKIVKFIPPK